MKYKDVQVITFTKLWISTKDAYTDWSAHDLISNWEQKYDIRTLSIGEISKLDIKKRNEKLIFYEKLILKKSMITIKT